MSSIDVSVLIPVYNNEQYLRKCLDSVMNQTINNIEVLMINDGSIDGSLEIMREYSQRDERFLLIDKPNTGYGQSLNLGFDKAKGKYIAIVESDDWVLPTFLEDLLNASSCSGIDLDIIKSDYQIFKSVNGEDVIQSRRFAVKNPRLYHKVITICDTYLQKEIDVHSWNGIYRREFIQKNKIRHNETPGASYQDTGFRWQYVCLNESIQFIDKVGYSYRIDNPQSSINDKKKALSICDEYDFVFLFLHENDQYEEYLEVFNDLKYAAYKWNYYRIEDGCKKIFLKRWKKEFKDSKWPVIYGSRKEYYDKIAVRILPPFLYVFGSKLCKKK